MQKNVRDITLTNMLQELRRGENATFVIVVLDFQSKQAANNLSADSHYGLSAVVVQEDMSEADYKEAAETVLQD
ncbi:hypothetical protein PR048_031955 [Dryococelus australis]|uniref:Uncharacterized protein n=1 Tax=Dryococelus australis TaxID=614101 RepID=A0ABQ9G6R5_9NEOP|nr:hypothetical protein PR048_031955 [Dryococelus australis]